MKWVNDELDDSMDEKLGNVSFCFIVHFLVWYL